jgi:peptidase E
MDDDFKQINVFKSYYESIGFKVNILYTYNKNISHSEIENEFMSNDIIYFGGGMTSKLIDFINKFNLKETIIKSYENNKIIAGVSAGAIMLFSYGFGDKEAFVDNLISINHKMTNGIGIFKATFCPHYQNSGGIFYHDEVRKFDSNGFAVENGAALKIYENNFEIIKSKNTNVFMFDKTDNYKLIHLKNGIIYDIELLK